MHRPQVLGAQGRLEFPKPHRYRTRGGQTADTEILLSPSPVAH